MNIPNISHPALKKLVEHEPHLFLDEKGTPDIKHITEKLALELETKLKGLRVSISDIEGVESRFVLLICSDDDLLDAVAAYIYCLRSVNGCTGLYYQSFRGKPDDYLANELTTKYIFKNDTTIRQYEAIADKEGSGTRVSTTGASTGYPKTMDGDLLDHIRQGRSVFLGDLKYPNSLLLEGLGKKIASIKTHWEMYQTDKRGLLIVSTLSEKDLPGYFAKQFEVIDFNPKHVQATEHITPTAQNLTSIPPAKDENVFRWCGGTWQMKFDNKEIYPPDSFGLRYIHHLLKHPNREIHVNDLKQITANSEEAKQPLKSKGKNVGTAEGLKETNIKHDLLDQDAIVEYNNRIKELKREKEDAEELRNDEKVAKIQEEIETIQGELKSSMGIGGTLRKFTDATEKNRVAITNCIRDALCKLEKTHPSLQEHLKAIETGEKCAYKPENNIDWNL